MKRLAAYLWDNDIPLMLARSVGFFGYLRVICKSHFVLHPRIMNPTFDLRIDCPFSGLQNLISETRKLLFHQDDEADADVKFERNHIPYLLLLVIALADWKAANGHSSSSHLPETGDEKKSFKAYLSNLISSKNITSENAEEAISKAFLVFKRHGVVSSSLQVIFQEESFLKDPKEKVSSIHTMMCSGFHESLYPF